MCPVITLTPAGGALAAGTYGQAYSQSIAVVGGGLHAFSITARALPSGITPSPGGVISGPPTNTGTFNFTVTATESNSGCSGSASYSIQVSPNAIDETYSGGVGNTQIVVSPAPFSSTPAVLVVGSVLGNDAGPGALSAGPAIIASTSGGSVALGASSARSSIRRLPDSRGRPTRSSIR